MAHTFDARTPLAAEAVAGMNNPDEHPHALLKRACRRHVGLLDNPEPGITSWHMAVEQNYQDIKIAVELEELRRSDPVEIADELAEAAQEEDPDRQRDEAIDREG